MKHIINIIILLLLSYIKIFGLIKEPKEYTYPVNIISKGGTGLTEFENTSSLIMNPACLGLSQKTYIPFFLTRLNLNYNTINFFINYFSNTNILNILGNLSDLKLYFNLNSPLYLGYIGQNFGILLENSSKLFTQINPEPLLPTLQLRISEDIIITTGFGFEIPLPFLSSKFWKFYSGINLKYYTKLKFENNRLGIIEGFNLFNNINSFFENYELPGIYFGQGIGSDFGFLLKSENIYLGLVIRDWFFTLFSWNELRRVNLNNSEITWQFHTNKLENTYYEPTLDIEFSYKFSQILSKYLISDLNFYFDIINIFDFSENYLLKFRVGGEITLFYILKIRGGIYKGYPTFGIGLDLPILKINCAYYTEELGFYPGNIPLGIIIGELQLSF